MLECNSDLLRSLCQYLPSFVAGLLMNNINCPYLLERISFHRSVAVRAPIIISKVYYFPYMYAVRQQFKIKLPINYNMDKNIKLNYIFDEDSSWFKFIQKFSFFSEQYSPHSSKVRKGRRNNYEVYNSTAKTIH